MIDTSHIPKIGDAKIKSSITDVLEENKKLKLIVIQQQKEISALKAEQTHENTKLLSSEEIKAKLSSVILHEIGFFHTRSKLSNPQGIMLTLGSLLGILRNATMLTGEYWHYDPVFQMCDQSLDEAMNFYMTQNYTAEMQRCRTVQVALGRIVNRGYAEYDLGTYEQILLEKPGDTE
jgi:hypothetical protein